MHASGGNATGVQSTVGAAHTGRVGCGHVARPRGRHVPPRAGADEVSATIWSHRSRAGRTGASWSCAPLGAGSRGAGPGHASARRFRRCPRGADHGGKCSSSGRWAGLEPTSGVRRHPPSPVRACSAVKVSNQTKRRCHASSSCVESGTGSDNS